MAGKENPVAQAVRIFDESIYAMRDSQVEGINAMAGRAVRRFRRGDLTLVGNHPTFDIPSITGFDLHDVSQGSHVLYTPVVVINFDKVRHSSPEAVKGDLARTIAIADQFPNNGFQRRYSTVYGDALDAQATWLEATNTPEIVFDPRTTDREELRRRLVGDARYYMDVGIEDWQNAIDGYKNSGEDPSAAPMLDQMRDASDHFIAMRQRFVPVQYPLFLAHADGPPFTDGPDKRAEIVAYTLMGATLYAREPDN